jgi:diguanylate cyclase (GGDEF)-like protein
VGDRVLRRTGRTLRRLARLSDLVGRIGGEEFLVALPATGAEEAMQFAERVRAAIALPSHRTGIPAVAASVGVAIVSGTPPLVSWLDAVAQADAALYRAKAEGRNRVVLAPPSQEAVTATRGSGGSASISLSRMSR